MNFQIISDLHGRINRMEINKKADILLFAGDSSENLDITFKMLNLSTIPVLFIPGNHEFYHKDYYDTYMRLKDFCDKSNGNIIFLDNEVVEIDDYQIIGNTLWSDFFNLDPFLIESSWSTINDYRCISTINQTSEIKEEILSLHEIHCKNIKDIMLGNDEIKKNILKPYLEKRLSTFNGENRYDYIDTNMFTPYHSFIMNKKNKKWLNNSLSDNFNGKRIVMTHHSPSYSPLVLGGYRASPFELITSGFERKNSLHKIGAYCNSMESSLLNNHVDTWIHGHFHEHLNYRMGGSHVICNATGNNKNEDLSFRNYIFNCSNEEKKSGLKDQLFLFNKSIIEIFHFFNNILMSDNSTKEISNIYFLKGYWREIEIILNNIQSLPYTEIPKSFNNYYPDPFVEFKVEDYIHIDYNDFKNILKKMLFNLKFMNKEIKLWISEI